MNEQLDAIFCAIDAVHPCGEDLSFSPEFDRIQEARREDDPTADYGEWTINLKQADWNAVVGICADLLIGRSKDLRVAAWLCEGLVKVSGLAGLTDGLHITTGLIRKFGKDLYPRLEGDDDEQRLGTLSWLVARLSQLVRRVPLTQAAAGEFGLVEYEGARSLQMQSQKAIDRPADAIDRPTLEKIAAAAAATDKDLYKTWLADADRARLLVDELSECAVGAFGDGCPSFTQLADGVDAVCDRLRAIASDRGLLAIAEGEIEPLGVAAAVPETVVPAFSTTSASALTRTQALAQLREVANFFRQTERHSPVAYLVDKAAKWGEMPLHEWLHEVVKDGGTLSQLDEMLGLNKAAEET